MNTSKYTPGPWVVNDLYADTEIRGPQNSGAMICVMSPWGIAADEPSPQRANARLIAAAPELLEALRECRALLSRSGLSFTSAAQNADSAIDKATGSAP